MLSLMLMESDDAVGHILRFYLPSGGKLLDCTYGKGTLVRAVPAGVTVTGLDLNPVPTANHDVRKGDLRQMPFSDSEFDAGLFDPPYLYGKKSEVLYDRPDTKWHEQHSNAFTPDDFVALANSAAKEIHRVCSRLAIVKVMNSRHKGRWVDNSTIVKNAFEANGWTVRDQIVYGRLGVGVFRNNKTAQVAHGFYWLFEKSSGFAKKQGALSAWEQPSGDERAAEMPEARPQDNNTAAEN